METFFRNKIFINGQHVNIKDSGGAGRYAMQMYTRFMSFDDYLFPLNTDISLLNFEEYLVKRKKKVFRYAQQLLPPFIWNYIYLSTKKRKRISDASDNNDLFLFSEKNVLIHELTNYQILNKIGRFYLSSNAILLVTFLDLQDFFYHEYFSDKELLQRRLLYAFYKEHANHFIAISEFTKEAMVKLLNIPAEKISVIYLAADDLSLFVQSEKTMKFVSSFGRYFIYPARAWLHKNHKFLIESFAKIRDMMSKKNIKLLLTGGFNHNDYEYLQKVIYNNKLEDRVCILGFVSDEQLQTLIRNAEYLVFPSLFEGFGMPVLEAMHLGCPVISSNAGALPEVCGDAAVYFDPKNKKRFVEILESLLIGNSVDRNIMIKKGFENCKRFSWDETFKNTVNVYKKLLQ